MDTNQEVVTAWIYGQRAKSQSLFTNRGFLWSYHLLIGINHNHCFVYRWTLSGRDRKEHARGLQVEQFTANGAMGFVSKTTSQHVGLVNRQIAEWLHA
jgi:hypothetical protein